MAHDPDVRWRQRLQNFRKAFGQLSAAATTARERDLSKLEQQGLIQAFEFTHELAWNTLKDFLEARGVTNLYGSKDATREAFATGLIDAGDDWMAMIQSRIQTTHTYNEQTADEIARAILSVYVREFETFLRRFSELESREP
ncbi:MAG: nucleotidyltransferase substrate binding protein [Chthoniobacterales bacterium]